jgi:uncharacterized membrane protein
MAFHEDDSRSCRSWPWWRWVLTGLSALGLALSAYLSWHQVAGSSMIGCGGGSPCDQVLSSKWSSIRGMLPVSGLAAGAYMAMLVAIFFIGPATEAPVRRLAWRAMLVIVGSAAGSAVWFTIVQKWIMRAFCPYCMATHITGLLLAALVIWRAPRQFDDDSTDAQTNPAPQRVIGFLPAIGMALVGLALAGAMAASQVGYTPPAVYRAGESQSQNSPPAIDPNTVPLIGSPDAPNVIILFFDHRCPHCQKVHAMLEEVIARYDSKLAFVLRPAPLNSQCNPYVARDREEFKDSCELARISLAVWAADRRAFFAFDQWWFSPEPDQLWRPRSLDAARAKAVELVGQEKLDAALADPLIDEFMQTSIRIYGNTVDQTGNSLPRLVFGTRWVSPEPNTVDDLVKILQDSLAVPQP